MPLIKLNPASDVPATEAVSLEAFLESNGSDGANVKAVRLEPADDPHALAPYLDVLDVIEVSFPKYANGTGYSQAQLLRRRLGFKGEIRAVGDVLRDQLLNMVRSGFDAFELDRDDGQEAFDAAMKEYSDFYQPAADGSQSVFARRHG